MQATVSDDGLSFMFTVTERKIISAALDMQSSELIRESRLRRNAGDHNKGRRAFLRMESRRLAAMAAQFREGEGYGL